MQTYVLRCRDRFAFSSNIIKIFTLRYLISEQGQLRKQNDFFSKFHNVRAGWNVSFFENFRPSASKFKSFSQSLEQFFFLTVGQNNNKIPFPSSFSRRPMDIRPSSWVTELFCSCSHAFNRCRSCWRHWWGHSKPYYRGQTTFWHVQLGKYLFDKYIDYLGGPSIKDVGNFSRFLTPPSAGIFYYYPSAILANFWPILLFNGWSLVGFQFWIANG